MPLVLVIRSLLVVSVIAALFGADALRSTVIRDKQVARSALPVVVTPPWLARVVSLGHELAAADVYWLKTLQYFGDRRYRAANFEQLEELLDLTIALDPRFCNAYRIAGLMLTSSEHFDMRAADRFMSRGVEMCPDDVALGLLYGFSLYYFESRFAEAGAVLSKVGRLPGAPPWVGDLAVRVLAHGGGLDTAEQMLNAMLESTEDTTARTQIEQRLQRVHSERLLRELDEAAKKYHDKHQRWPEDARVLALERLIPGMPRDPLGGQISFDAQGRAKSSAMPKRLELDTANLHQPASAPASSPASGATHE